MKTSTERFLKFNGQTISFLSVDGQYWIAIKPICKALNVDYIQQFKNIKGDKVFGSVVSKHKMHDSSNRLQNMTALPERYIYGYLFSIKSNSEELSEFKKECHDVLYNYFHGSITGRVALLKQKTELDREADALENKLAQEGDYLRWLEIKKDALVLNKDLKVLDEKVVSEQMELWEQDFEN